jgi:hypothetical protein
MPEPADRYLDRSFWSPWKRLYPYDPTIYVRQAWALTATVSECHAGEHRPQPAKRKYGLEVKGTLRSGQLGTHVSLSVLLFPGTLERAQEEADHLLEYAIQVIGGKEDA